MASPPKDPDHPELGGVDPAELQAYFVKSGRYTAGVATHYPPATVLTAEATHQDLAKGFTIGMRFHSAPVVRLADAKPMQLGHAARADGAWRIYAFADASGQRLRELADVPGGVAEFADPPLHAGRARTSTASSTFARSSSRATATSRSTSCRRCCCRARDASG